MTRHVTLAINRPVASRVWGWGTCPQLPPPPWFSDLIDNKCGMSSHLGEGRCKIIWCQKFEFVMCLNQEMFLLNLTEMVKIFFEFVTDQTFNKTFIFTISYLSWERQPFYQMEKGRICSSSLIWTAVSINQSSNRNLRNQFATKEFILDIKASGFHCYLSTRTVTNISTVASLGPEHH